MKYLMLALLIMSSFPLYAEARHTGAYGRVNTSSLDDDPAESFPVPVLFGVNYDSLIPDFGDPRGGGTRSHEGQDMRAPKGTPIVSPTEAVVISTGSGESAGNYVYTANPGGEVFRYMHLDHVADLDRGDKLNPGDFIGTVGDTGNAPDGVYHLHFEVRDGDNDATDPHPRMTDTFTLKEKISFLEDILSDFSRRDREDYAEFLITTYPAVFKEALSKKYRLPDEIDEALEDAGVTSAAKLQDQLKALIATIPKLLSMELMNGDQGAAVTLLQLYLMYSSSGEAHAQLLAAGATGYYGGITEAAVSEYQERYDLPVTGSYNTRTRTYMTELAK